MNVSILKRYCFKQANYGGIGEAITALADLQRKHPNTDIRLEQNERSTRTKYRVVRVAEFALELPDKPLEEAYQVPQRPKAMPRPDSEFHQEVVTEDGRVRLQLTHVATESKVSRGSWTSSAHSTWEWGYLRDELERNLDPTYDRRLAYWRERYDAWNRAVEVWREECNRLIHEASAS